ncbi:MAG: hypothetical protein RLZZ401_724 [Pseudomonadota bacterium]
MEEIYSIVGHLWHALLAQGGGVSAATNQALGGLDTAGLLALAAALGWASGMRLYLVVFITGVAGYLGWLPLPAGLGVLQHPLMLAASGFMLFIEFFADKIPGVDTLWDIVHSVIRVPAGAALAAGVFGADSATLGMAAGLLGGTLAATSYATKATTRAALNASPEPFSNIAASFLEEGLVMGGLWLATQHPAVFGVALCLVLGLSLWLLAQCLRFLRAIVARVAAFWGRPAGLAS